MINLTASEIDRYHRDGYLVMRGLFSPGQVATLCEHFEEIARGAPIKDSWTPDRTSTDPLKRYPRITQPHRYDELCLRWLLDPRVGGILARLLDDEPVAVQSMYYFKPPYAKGQALHQDDFYLQTKPLPCLAAWTAIDPSTPDNGGLFVVPGTHTLDVVCPSIADESQSFTTHFVAPPAGKSAVPVYLEPGDTLFFNGNVIHGSQPNRSTIWRRSFICHYVPRHTATLAGWFQPALDFNGNVIPIDSRIHGGPCGVEFSAFWDGLNDAQKRELVTRF